MCAGGGCGHGTDGANVVAASEEANTLSIDGNAKPLFKKSNLEETLATESICFHAEDKPW
jgi:hypothetical protein